MEPQNLLIDYELMNYFSEKSKENMRQTMLRHEQTFRKQVLELLERCTGVATLVKVQELHTLYGMQKVLMHDARPQAANNFLVNRHHRITLNCKERVGNLSSKRKKPIDLEKPPDDEDVTEDEQEDLRHEQTITKGCTNFFNSSTHEYFAITNSPIHMDLNYSSHVDGNISVLFGPKDISDYSKWNQNIISPEEQGTCAQQSQGSTALAMEIPTQKISSLVTDNYLQTVDKKVNNFQLVASEGQLYGSVHKYDERCGQLELSSNLYIKNYHMTGVDVGDTLLPALFTERNSINKEDLKVADLYQNTSQVKHGRPNYQQENLHLGMSFNKEDDKHVMQTKQRSQELEEWKSDKADSPDLKLNSSTLQGGNGTKCGYYYENGDSVDAERKRPISNLYEKQSLKESLGNGTIIGREEVELLKRNSAIHNSKLIQVMETSQLPKEDSRSHSYGEIKGIEDDEDKARLAAKILVSFFYPEKI